MKGKFKVSNRVDFEKVKEIWKKYAMSENVKAIIDKYVPVIYESELRKQLNDTTQGRKFIDLFGFPPLISTERIDYLFLSSDCEKCLNVEEMELIRNYLNSVGRIKSYLKKGRQHEISLAYYEENLDDIKEIQNEIYNKICNGEIVNNASKSLYRIRNEIIENERKVQEKLNEIIRKNKMYLSNDFITSRKGHYCIPIKKEYKYKIEGNFVDKSLKGGTVFIEPFSVAKYCEKINLLKIDEEKEVSKILYELSDRIYQYRELFVENSRIIEKMDFIFSKAKMSYELDCIEPQINTEREVFMDKARHPLMDAKEYVPLDFSLGKDTKGMVITGPNTGGKTLVLKTVALNCMMAQCGLHIPCNKANICMNLNYLFDIGDGQNIWQNLSTFSSHISNIIGIINDISEESFVFLDELGSGTDPSEGMGIAIAILEKLIEKKCLFLVTTHFPEVKKYVSHQDYVEVAKMEFDKNTLKPMYKLIIGEAGESYAFYIAYKLGLPKDILQNAINVTYGESYELDIMGDEQKVANNGEKVNYSRKIIKSKKVVRDNNFVVYKYNIGDSVMIYPHKIVGIVCDNVNDKGEYKIQVPNKKIWVNHKRLKLLVKANELYPENYDFSIIFDTVENRKKRHNMRRKYTKEIIEENEE